MGLYEYMMLTAEEQWDYLWEKGNFVTEYISIDCKYALYALDKFFVEVELCVSTDKIIGKNLFVEGRAMDKYILDSFERLWHF